MNIWRTQIFHCVLFLFLFVETYRDDGQCAVCLEEGCKTGVSRIILDKCDETLWQKKNKIPECSVGNLKPDAPCMISNGNLVLRTEQTLYFEDTDVGKIFHSTNMPCADLNLPAGLKPSSGAPDLNQINATTNSTTTPASAWPPWKIAITVCGSGILMNMWSPWIFLSGMVGLCFGEAYPYDELQFSIPIQCTDVSAERSEGPLGSFSTAVRSREEEEEEEDEEGANPEDGRFFADSLMELSVRFLLSADGERKFLNSAVGNPAGAVTGISMATEEMSLGKAIPLPMPHAGSASTNLPHEGICGPQQLRWSPDLCESTAQGACEAPPRDPNHGKCEFCNALVPFAEIYSHLNSHFQSPTSNGH